MDNTTANLNQGVPQPINQPGAQVPTDQGSVYSGSSNKKKLLGIIIGIVVVILIIVIGIFIFMRPSPDGPAEITYWGIWEDEAVFNEIIEDFEANNPNITVNYEQRIDIKDAPGGGYIPFLKSRIDADNGPDVFRYHTSWLFALQNYLAPLPSDISNEVNIPENYFSVVSEDVGRNGAFYGIPLG